ncbi:YdcF family protein [Mesorhizobium sp. ES1-1]|uniref:YdcF family protein n=1 Tax=Mesorhizobium sp. ES1-1 TaxID=2876629 RepID=UPI001CCD008A|nr:YdcF family protein [Mesorhizobium sp. ES1-1]MBZ9676650.1 YdcF family protein [Mesorhizobium sp. ES1-1]
MDTKLITQCFFPSDSQANADVAIVFGMSNPARPLARAVELFEARMVRALLLTGGYNEKLRAVEAHEMARLARQRGVPADAILVEDRAVNTEQNVAFAWDMLQSRFGRGAIGSVMLLTIHYHMRRAYLAARRRLPADVALHWACYPSIHYSSENWFDVEQGRRDVESEIAKIERYYSLSLPEIARQIR